MTFKCSVFNSTFFQWAKIVITLERAIPQSDAHNYLQEYSISLGPSEDPSTEQRGVMVIKSKSKTRAKQRKGAVANWKVGLLMENRRSFGIFLA